MAASGASSVNFHESTSFSSAWVSAAVASGMAGALADDTSTRLVSTTTGGRASRCSGSMNPSPVTTVLSVSDWILALALSVCAVVHSTLSSSLSGSAGPFAGFARHCATTAERANSTMLTSPSPSSSSSERPDR